MPPLRRFLGAGIVAATVGVVGVSSMRVQQVAGSTVEVPFARADRLADGADAAVLRAASLLRSYPKARATVTGYTQPGGDPAADQALADARASVVAQALEADGVDASRLVAAGSASGGTLPRLQGEGDAEWEHRMARAEIRVAVGR